MSFQRVEGYVLSGTYRMTVSGEEEILAAGGSYCVPAGVSHAREVVPAGEAAGVSPVGGECL